MSKLMDISRVLTALHTTTYNEDGTINTIAKVQDWPDDYAVKVHRR